MKICTSIQQINRFWGKVDKSGDCWEWGAYKDKQGYGQFGLDGKLQYVHRVSYIWARGVIPEGYLVHHECENPGCVNPSHLELITPGDHMREHHTGAWKRYCKHGHERTPESVYKSGHCKLCRQTPEGKAKQAASDKKYYATPEGKAKQSARDKKRYEDKKRRVD